jgi:hypothetical protein
MKRVLLGSVARHVLHSSRAMLLVLKPTDAAAHASAASGPGTIRRDLVDEAGRDSCPASDPPSWSTLISRTPGDW